MTEPNDAQNRKRRMRNRNLALMAVLFGLMVLFYVVTIVRVGSGEGS
ncbi:MAG: hypothetical protein ACKVGZ_10395 [Alphaproteobacteria bacterium]|jgi:uncharacterized membrane protein YsdA (DUF1294 family)